MVPRCCLVLLFLASIVDVTVLMRCRDCDYQGGTYTSLTRFGVQLSRCHFQRCFCRCDGYVSCPLSQRKVTCKDECVMCRNPFTGRELPPFTNFRHRSKTFGLMHCECGCRGSYSCTSVHGHLRYSGDTPRITIRLEIGHEHKSTEAVI